jgi:hypothetical protein
LDEHIHTTKYQENALDPCMSTLEAITSKVHQTAQNMHCFDEELDMIG